MARPCGCAGECGCTYVGVDGVKVTGTGTSRDPGRIGLNNPIAGAGCDAIMSCVGNRLGPGLRYTATEGEIAAALSADGGNSLIYGTDGGLYTSGGSGGDGGGATADGLAARTTPIVGGSYGGGISLWPEGDTLTYRAAMAMSLDMIHVPIRRSREYFIYAQHYRNLSAYNFRYAAGDTTDAFDLMTAINKIDLPSGDPSGDWDRPTYAAQAGYFGFYRRIVTDGIVRLSDVFEITQRRSVLYLQCLDLGTSVNDVAVPSDTLGNLRPIIAQYGATRNVIVGSTFPTAASTADRASITAGLALVRNAGIAIAAHFNTKAEMDTLPPATLVANGYKWVMVSYNLAELYSSQVRAYKDAGLNVMLHSAHRQWHWNLAKDTTRFGTGGLKGVLSYDPVYCAGETTNYRYRRPEATWEWTSPDYGRHSGWSDSIEGQRDRYRGYVLGAKRNVLNIDGDVLAPGDVAGALRDSAYYILIGEVCPVPLNPATGKHDSYDIEVGFAWDALVTDKNRWMGIWFANPEDRPLYEWTRRNEHTRGYQLILNQRGEFRLDRYDGDFAPTNHNYQLTWNSPWFNAIDANVEYRLKIRVRPDRIVVGPASQSETGTNTRTFNVATGGGDRWRGPYVYLGRHFHYASVSTRCQFHRLRVTAV